MGNFIQDIRYGGRMLTKTPSLTSIALVTLALGIGANTAIFSVVNALILNPPRIADPDRAVAIWLTAKGKRTEGFVSYLDLRDWQRSLNASFEAVAGYKPNGFTLLSGGEAERIQGLRVTANFLGLLRVGLLRGRDFQEVEEKRGAEPVAIISFRFWQDRLGGDEGAVGQKLTLNGELFSIIGILPPGFEFPLAPRENDLLTTVAGEGSNLDERGAQVLKGIGRLKAGVTLEQAQADLTRVAEGLEQQYPDYYTNTTAFIVSVDEQIVGRDVRSALWLLLGAVGFILLIACTNVANLLLVRTSARRKELALRAALGARTWRIARQLLTESLLLGLLAGGAGLLVAMWGLGAIRYYGAKELPRIDEVQIDGLVLGFTLAVSLLTALMCGLIPVFSAARPNLNEALKAGGKTTSGAGSGRWWRDSLVAAEVSLGLVLLIGAGLMIRSFDHLVNIHPGFDPENVLTGRISLTRTEYDNSDARVRYVTQTLARLEALPGIEQAAFVAPMPFSGADVGSNFRIEGRPRPDPGQEPVASVRSVTPGYFQAIRIPLLKGRYFTDHDQPGGVGAAIINETLARLYFSDDEPIGKRITNVGANQNEGDPEQWEIVGIIADVHHNSLTKPANPELYLPYLQNSWPWGNFLVRTRTDPGGLAGRFVDEIRAGDKTVPVTGVQPLTRAIASTVSQDRFYTFLFALFGATGLVLTLTGIYGVISYTVAQRTQEIGIRMALGAHAASVVRLVVARGLKLAVFGVALGLAGSALLTRLLGKLLYGVEATDPATFAVISGLLLASAFAACLIPARRAARVDPMVALRCE